VPHWQKGVQARQRRERGRGEIALHDPNAWTVGLIVATGLALIARHPIARAIGTENPAARSDVTTGAPVRPDASGPRVPALALPVAPAATHAPRDPFRALVSAGGKLLAPVALETAGRRPVASAPKAAPATTTTTPTGCSGTTHRVVAGDTLWGLAARAVRGGNGHVTFAWHRLYDANRAVIGSDPALLRVGTTLCVPTSLSR